MRTGGNANTKCDRFAFPSVRLPGQQAGCAGLRATRCASGSVRSGPPCLRVSVAKSVGAIAAWHRGGLCALLCGLCGLCVRRSSLCLRVSVAKPVDAAAAW